MAVQPGEENVATLFGDVHYFYGPEEQKPRHHRFDKGSFVYLFEDANQGRARLEIANQPGTDDQDAFDGYLDYTHLRYSYKQTCVVTLEIGDVPDQEQWHLPTYDPNNKNKYHYKLHSLDIYFWTQDDALQFVNGIRRVIAPQQCEVLDEPGPPAQRSGGDINSVVSRLEKAVISQPQAQAANGALPGPPPMSAVSGSSASPPGGFVPMAYNPSAPPAPEAVRPREKTPPPEDGALNPLQQTLASDAATPFSPGLVPSGLGPLSPGVPPPQYHSPTGAPTFAPPPQHSVLSPGLPPSGFGTHPGLQRAATVPVAPGIASPYGPGGFPASPSFAPPPQAGATANVIAGPPQHTATPPAQAMAAPGPPPGGYSQYSYANAQHNAAALAGQGQYNVHNQMYRPTEAEMGAGAKPGSQYQAKDSPRGRLEENAGRLERGVTGMFKKFEKKFG